MQSRQLGQRNQRWRRHRSDSAALALRRVARISRLFAAAAGIAAVEIVKLFPPAVAYLVAAKWARSNSISAIRKLLMHTVRETIPIVSCVNQELATKANLHPDNAQAIQDCAREFTDRRWSDILDAHRLELTRRASIRQRVQSNANIVAVLVGVLSAGATLLPGTRVAGFSAFIVFLLTLVIVSLAMSAFCAIRAITVEHESDRWLQERFGAKRGVGVTDAEKLRVSMMILVNQGHTLIIANYAGASHTCMRNAIVLLCTVAIVVLVGGK